MKHRSELLQVYSSFAKMVETQFSKRIKIFRFDNALKYTQSAFQAVLHSYGMVELNENFVIFLTLFMLSFSLPKFLLLFGAKLHFMLFILLIAFPVLSSTIKFYMSVFLGYLQIIITFASSVLPVCSFLAT